MLNKLRRKTETARTGNLFHEKGQEHETARVVVYSTTWCPSCRLASGLEAPPGLETSTLLSNRVDARLKALAEGRIMERTWACDYTVWKPDPTERLAPSQPEGR